jgi:hypothetical protein
MRPIALVALLLVCSCSNAERGLAGSASSPPTQTDASTSVASASAAPAAASAAKPVDPVAEKGRAFVALLAAGKHAEAAATFDATMTKALPEAKLAETWAGLQAGVGAFEAVEGTRVEPMGAYDTALVTCKFARARLEAKIAFDRAGKVAGLFFAQAPEPYTDPPYVDRAKIEEHDVKVGSGEWALPGTLTLPKGAGPFRAAVLVHGSGPGDRDASVGANRPFQDLAGGLAARGIAVLRYEKRTKVHAAKASAAKDFTVDQEAVEDAVAAVALLRERKDVDAAHVVVVGHSLGGQLAPRIGSRTDGVAAVAILAGSTRPVADMVLEQTKYIAALDGRVAPEEEEQVRAVEAARARIRALQAGAAPNTDEMVLGAGPAYWIHLGKYDALGTAKSLKKPIFVAQGGRDYQVTHADLDAWKKALAGRKDVTFQLYPELNHLFGAGEGKSSPEEYQRRTPVDARLVQDLAAWIAAL